MAAPRKAVFFDRDGVLNRAEIRDGRPYAPATADELQWMDGVLETLPVLRARGYLLLVFTNQPDVARGTQSRSSVVACNERLQRELPIARVYTCFHDDSDACACRKPKPGMIYQGRDDYGIDLAASWVVGDRWRDIDAGKAAGCRTIYLRQDYNEKPATGYDAAIEHFGQLLALIP
jgi:D-glycero-D-manno-heptose 1,7-bisphosphate phosphatase